MASTTSGRVANGLNPPIGVTEILLPSFAQRLHLRVLRGDLLPFPARSARVAGGNVLTSQPHVLETLAQPDCRSVKSQIETQSLLLPDVQAVAR
jgi:hypothetical protein